MSGCVEPFQPESGFYNGRSESPMLPIQSEPKDNVDVEVWERLKVTNLPAKAIGYIFTYVCDDIVDRVKMQVSRLLPETRNILRIVNHKITDLVVSNCSFSEQDLHEIGWCYKNLQFLDLQGNTVKNKFRIGKQKKESFFEVGLKSEFKRKYFPHHDDLVVIGEFQQLSLEEVGSL